MPCGSGARRESCARAAGHKSLLNLQRSADKCDRLILPKLKLSAYADDGYQGNAGGHVLATRVDADGHEVRPEHRTPNVRAGGVRRDSGDARVPAAHEHAGVRVAL